MQMKMLQMCWMFFIFFVLLWVKKVLAIEYMMHLFMFSSCFSSNLLSWSMFLLFLYQTSMSIVLFCCLSTSTVWYAFINVLGKLVKNQNATTVKSQCFDDNSKVLMHAPTTCLNLFNGNWELGTKPRILTLPSKLKHFLKPSIPIGLFWILAFI